MEAEVEVLRQSLSDEVGVCFLVALFLFYFPPGFSFLVLGVEAVFEFGFALIPFFFFECR